MAELPTARHGLSLVEANGKLYAIGGRACSAGPNEEYDPATSNWTAKAPVPTVRIMGYSAVTVCQNKIYVIGGYPSLGKYPDANEAYDPVSNTWETKTPIPVPREGCSACTFNGKIYVLGGGRTGVSPDLEYFTVYYNFTDVYDPATDSWSTASPMPTRAYTSSAVVFEDKIYVLGKGIIQVYNPKTDTWLPEIKPNVTFSESATMVATSGKFAPKRIHIVDAEAHYIYDPENDSWSVGAPMLTVRNGFAVAVVNDKLYAVGGYHQNSWWSRKNEEYTPVGYGTIQAGQLAATVALGILISVAVIGVSLLVYFIKRNR
jgi:N-acetylneuraminic acid mutarotase